MRCGTSRSPNSRTITSVPITTGMPAIANSANPNAPTPAFCAASEITTLTGLPVSSSRDPALPANASGISSREGCRERRMAITIVIGRSAATAPLSPMSAVRPAESSIV